MLYVQIAHNLSLNDVADTLCNPSGALATIRRATPPGRNGLSHANRVRDPNMAQTLFRDVLSHTQNKHPDFGCGHKYSGLPGNSKEIFLRLLEISRSLDESKIQTMIAERDYEELDLYIMKSLLEHFNFLCIDLGRSEDFGQQGRKRRFSYSKPSFSNEAG